LVGLSSTFQDQVPTLRRVIQALSKLDVRAVVTLGPALSASEVPTAQNVCIVETAPHTEILKQATLLITHCGHGTTMKGLVAGVPLVCIPMGRDQNDNAARVVHAHAGVRLTPAASEHSIRDAIQRVLGDPTFTAGARRLQRAIQSKDGCMDPIAVIESLTAASLRAAA
jgi:UDP:flavonoid glycosyltransferase YjiC (YdhE family)